MSHTPPVATYDTSASCHAGQRCHHSCTRGTRPLIGDDSVDADSAEVLSTAAGEVGLSGDVETEGALLVLRGNQEVALVAGNIGGRHL